jgi:hypothetical protein
MHMGTKFAPAYACIFMAMVETEFLEQQVTSLFCKPTDCHQYLHYES